MPTLKPPSEILKEFQSLNVKVNSSIKKETLKKFIGENFSQDEGEMIHTSLHDFKPDPAFLDGIKDPILKQFGSVLHHRWKDLAREFKQDVLKCPLCSTSAITVPNKFIIPGGRFRETYYWDTLFIQEGLLKSELLETTKGIIENFLHVVEKYGFFPNGLRVYYLNRSQPPVLPLMVYKYVEATNDQKLLERALPILEKEYEWFMKHRLVSIISTTIDGIEEYKLNRYNVENNEPRPESYIEDLELAKELTSEQEKKRLYSNLASACESGWDFSPRWTSTTPLQNNEKENLINHITSEIIPVDLNSLMLTNEKLFSVWFSTIINNTTKSNYYKKQYDTRRIAMKNVLWKSSENKFYDYNLNTNSSQESFNPATLWPFWLMYNSDDEKVVNSCKELSTPFNQVEKLVNEYPGGIPTTLDMETGLQWSLPNAWPPLQYSTIKAIQNGIKLSRNMSCGFESQFSQILRNMTQGYVNNVYCGWRKSGGYIPNVIEKLVEATSQDDDEGFFYEKYNVYRVGETGDGGEYDPQVGFGWTNGIAIWVLAEFGKDLELPTCDTVSNSRLSSPSSESSGLLKIDFTFYPLWVLMMVTLLYFVHRVFCS